MVLFDVKKYETPSAKDVDMDLTKHNVGVFLSAYLSARCRVGQPREPKVLCKSSYNTHMIKKLLKRTINLNNSYF